MIYRIIETNFQYIILVSKASGHFIEKNDTPEGFEEFINRIKNNYSI